MTCNEENTHIEKDVITLCNLGQRLQREGKYDEAAEKFALALINCRGKENWPLSLWIQKANNCSNLKECLSRKEMLPFCNFIVPICD
jgi:hypothetical protein